MFHCDVFFVVSDFVPHAVNICFAASLVLINKAQCKLLLAELPRGNGLFRGRLRWQDAFLGLEVYKE